MEVHTVGDGEMGILGPHTGKLLVNCTYGTFHGVASDNLVAWCNDSSVLLKSKDLEK